MTSWAIRHRFPLLLAVAALLFLSFLGTRDLWYPDEPDIAEVAQAMYRSGDWIAPRRNGVIWVDYPPLLYWAGSLSAHALGGMSDYALRLPVAISGILLVLLTAAVAARRHGATAALWAGLLLATGKQFFDNATEYRTDLPFSLFVAAGVFAWARGVGERPHWGWRAAAFASFGFAMLTKGPLGLLLPGLVLTLWHGARREYSRVLELAPWSLLSVAVYLPWFWACAEAMGVQNIWHELWAQNVERFLAGERGHEKPFWYYAANIWADLAPWSPLLPFALWWHWRNGTWRNRTMQLWLWWFGASFLFLSIAVTKRQVYLLPAYPAIALLIGSWLQAMTAAPVAAQPRSLCMGSGILTFAMLVAGLVILLGGIFLAPLLAQFELDPFLRDVMQGLRWPVVALGAAALLGGAWSYAAWRQGECARALLRFGLATVVVHALTLGWAEAKFNPVKTYAPSSRWVRAQIGPDATHIGLLHLTLGHHKMGAFGYYSGALVVLIDDAQELAQFWQAHPDSLVMAYQPHAERVLPVSDPGGAFRVVRELRVARDRYLVLART